MISYLAYAIIFNCIVKELPVKRDINISQEPIQFWYPMLWKHKASFHRYKIHDSFLGRCREILAGEVPDRVIREDINFIDGKGFMFSEEEHTHFKLFGFEGAPSCCQIL